MYLIRSSGLCPRKPTAVLTFRDSQRPKQSWVCDTNDHRCNLKPILSCGIMGFRKESETSEGNLSHFGLKSGSVKWFCEWKKSSHHLAGLHIFHQSSEDFRQRTLTWLSQLSTHAVRLPPGKFSGDWSYKPSFLCNYLWFWWYGMVSLHNTHLNQILYFPLKNLEHPMSLTRYRSLAWQNNRVGVSPGHDIVRPEMIQCFLFK